MSTRKLRRQYMRSPGVNPSASHHSHRRPRRTLVCSRQRPPTISTCWRPSTVRVQAVSCLLVSPPLAYQRRAAATIAASPAPPSPDPCYAGGSPFRIGSHPTLPVGLLQTKPHTSCYTSIMLFNHTFNIICQPSTVVNNLLSSHHPCRSHLHVS